MPLAAALRLFHIVRIEKGVWLQQTPFFRPNPLEIGDLLMMPQNTYPAQLVDWAGGRLLPAPRQNRPDRHETFFPAKCANPACGHIRWLTRCAAERAEAEGRVCRRCQTTEAGKRGFAATAARYGPDFALRAVQKHQREKPSCYEVVVDSWLSDLGADYDSQVLFSTTDDGGVTHHFILDFLVRTVSGALAVEVNGYHHKRYRALRDYWLARLYTDEVMFIDTDDIDDRPDEVKARLREAMHWQR